MTRILTAALLAAAATLAIGTASAQPLAALTTAPHLSAPACAPVTVLERRGEWSRVTLGETHGWVRDADLAAARCREDAEIALDARYVPREEATTAYA
ncbi:hypothetical protein [Pararhodobacter aggregans]|uniref:SH3 domain-containing protein n=1 Tax=Pararhodobacter aggregans TaxID=404875 RepID=A0A2T7UQW4_9RHOB|nr:hypothetical protein [Pararhodobacter aggregans]PTX01955.1 hypothetical protein C8N33_106173 [Pararhodobacter aggregans]PVE47140.1 hypothetical protein DDE23_12900 [Pararhodobacter aggregans]